VTRSRDTSRRRRRWPRYLLVTALVLVLLFYGGGGFYFSNVLDERGLDGAALRADTAAFEPDVVIERAEQAEDGSVSVAVRATADTASGLDRDAIVGLRWANGYGQLNTSTSELRMLDGDVIEGPAQFDVRAFPQDPLSADLGLEQVAVAGPLGNYPAWVASPLGETTRDTWAIVVHGNSLSPADGLRMVPILTEAGFPTMVASYRNDPGAPPDPSGKLRYGLTEWKDLEAMVRYALAQGSEGVVLDGYSMGGGIVMAFLQRSELADEVRAVVLDAPMLDFSETVDDNASREEIAPGVALPQSLTSVAKWIASWRFGVDWSELNYLADTSAYERLPFLVFHGTDDDTVPISTSREFKRLLPDQVQLVECPGAGHIECWNPDPVAYGSAVTAFLDATV
jgi:uncharacterized protein